jgi:hypothetical protein
VFVADPDLGMEGGVRTTHSIRRLLDGYDTYVTRWLGTDDARIAIPGRLLEAVFLELPVDSAVDVFVHEVYGHGARGREAGFRPQYQFAIPLPYFWLFHQTGFSGFTTDAGPTSPDRDLATTAAGLEAQYDSAFWLTAEMMRADSTMTEGDLIAYGLAKLGYFGRFAGLAKASTDGGSDPDRYVTELEEDYNRYTAADRRHTVRRLQAAYVFDLVDPTLALAAYDLLVGYLVQGERRFHLPSITAGDFELYPSTRFNLSPFGAEHYLDLFARHGRDTFDAYLRFTSSGLAEDLGAGVRAFNYALTDDVTVGGDLDVWAQRELIFDPRYVFDRPDRLGAGTSVSVEYRAYGRLGVTCKVGYKSRGYLMAEPLDAGPYGYLGFIVY